MRDVPCEAPATAARTARNSLGEPLERGQQREDHVLPADRARTPRQGPAPPIARRLPPRVAAHAHVNVATAAIDGACVIVGSLTRYQSRNDPVATSDRRERRPVLADEQHAEPIGEEQPDSPQHESGDADGLPVGKRRAVQRHVSPPRGQRVRDASPTAKNGAQTRLGPIVQADCA